MCLLSNIYLLLLAATKLGQGNVFTGVCDSVNRGGVPGQVPPRTRYPPSPQTRYPLTRYSPPPGPGTPPRPGTPPPGTRYSPPDQVPPDQVLPPDQVHPPDQVLPPLGPGTPPPQIQSMSGRYASYWNAFLFQYILGKSPCLFQPTGMRFKCWATIVTTKTPTEMFIYVTVNGTCKIIASSWWNSPCTKKTCVCVNEF